jgi:hypothetical protein
MNLKSKKQLWALIMCFFATTWFACNKEEDSNPVDTCSSGTCTVYKDSTISGVPYVYVKDLGEGTGNKTWTKDKIWVLDGFVFVNSGQELTIEAGTIIKALEGTEANASALIVARGGKIMAQGSDAEPIIFTSILDGVFPSSTAALKAKGTLGKDIRGLWGGVVILGSASLNTVPNTQQFEGLPSTITRANYGGTNDADNSGILSYIQIRHGGSKITADKEINGLSLGGVGSGTTINHIEIVANADDGIEFFGGTVSTKYIASVFNDDDAFDYDQGYRGNNQFWFGLQEAVGDYGGEFDGADTPEDGTPYGIPTLANVTIKGRNDKRVLIVRANGGLKLYNSILYDFANPMYIEASDSIAQNSYTRLTSGDIQIKNNIVFNITNANDSSLYYLTASFRKASSGFKPNVLSTLKQHFIDNGNSTTNPTMVNFEPSSGYSATPVSGTFFDAGANYKGCFNPTTDKWTKNWTYIYQNNLVID